MPMSYELALHCCFCGKPIGKEKSHTVTVEVEGGGQQRMFAHRSCLSDRLDPSVPLGQPGTFGVELQNRQAPASTLRRVIIIGLVVVVVLLAPVVVLMLVD